MSTCWLVCGCGQRKGREEEKEGGKVKKNEGEGGRKEGVNDGKEGREVVGGSLHVLLLPSSSCGLTCS